jgi:crossover junction endodeoxyribonuclease RusA
MRMAVAGVGQSAEPLRRAYRVILVALPWPDKRVSPNYRQSHHWRSYAPAVKAQRFQAHQLALAAFMPNRPKFDSERILVEVHFYPPDRRGRDEDGMIGSAKSAIDGIADALNVDDKRFRCTYWFHAPEKPGRIEVRVG